MNSTSQAIAILLTRTQQSLMDEAVQLVKRERPIGDVSICLREKKSSNGIEHTAEILSGFSKIATSDRVEAAKTRTEALAMLVFRLRELQVDHHAAE